MGWVRHVLSTLLGWELCRFSPESGSLGYDRLWYEAPCGLTQGRPCLPEPSVLQRPAASRRDGEIGLLRLLTGFGSLNKLCGNLAHCLSLSFSFSCLRSLSSHFKKIVSTKPSDMLLYGETYAPRCICPTYQNHLLTEPVNRQSLTSLRKFPARRNQESRK